MAVATVYHATSLLLTSRSASATAMSTESIAPRQCASSGELHGRRTLVFIYHSASRAELTNAHRAQCISSPPLTLSASPVMKPASSDTRKATADAVSLGLPTLASGTRSAMPAR